MPRSSNTNRQDDMQDDIRNEEDDDHMSSRGNVRAASRREDPERDEGGRFASGNPGRRARASDDQVRDERFREDDDAYGQSRASGRSGQGRGWFGDPEGHAQAGSHSHDNTRTMSRSRSGYDENDRSGRDRNAQGQFTGRSQADDDAEYGAWHAYGHNRGWHAYQQRGNRLRDDRLRDEEGRFTSSGRGSAYDDDYRGNVRAGSRMRDDRLRDDEGRFVSASRSSDYDDDYRGGNRMRDDRLRDEEGRFTSSNRH